MCLLQYFSSFWRSAFFWFFYQVYTWQKTSPPALTWCDRVVLELSAIWLLRRHSWGRIRWVAVESVDPSLLCWLFVVGATCCICEVESHTTDMAARDQGGRMFAGKAAWETLPSAPTTGGLFICSSKCIVQAQAHSSPFSHSCLDCGMLWKTDMLSFWPCGFQDWGDISREVGLSFSLAFYYISF